MLYPLSYGRLFFSCVADASAAAEARGFEPPVAFEGDNSLAVSPIRPLWHASRRFTADPTEYTSAMAAGKARFRHP
jgi:histidinol-phosphate aminotransferase